MCGDSSSPSSIIQNTATALWLTKGSNMIMHIYFLCTFNHDQHHFRFFFVFCTYTYATPDCGCYMVRGQAAKNPCPIQMHYICPICSICAHCIHVQSKLSSLKHLPSDRFTLTIIIILGGQKKYLLIMYSLGLLLLSSYLGCR